MGVVIRGRELQVDVKAEISLYPWYRAKWLEDRVIACSPFRDDKNPSFAVFLANGVWVDSGALTEDWQKGNLIRLLSFLRNETYEETEEYLISEYAPERWDVDDLKLDIHLKEEVTYRPLSMDLLEPFKYAHPYLERRGITKKTQRAVKIGYDPASKSIVIPWFDRHGNLVTWKQRSVVDKIFWYYAEGQPIRRHLYGLDLVYRLNRKEEVFITEGEIDALTLWQSGRPAIALGGATLSEVQKRLIIQSGIKKIIVATDNDTVGERVKSSLINRLSGYVKIAEVVFPSHTKDINDFRPEELKTLAYKEVGLRIL